jgi:hypothetical protein
MNRKKLVLCLLVLALIGSVAYSILRAPKQQQTAALKYRPGAAALAPRKGAAPARSGSDQARLNVELLDRDLPRFSGYRRNIFSPIFRDEVKLPPFKPLPPPPQPVLPLPPPPQVAQAPPPPAAPTEDQVAASDLGKITFLGFLNKNGDKTVFLSSNDEIFLAKKGSNLGTKYQVTDLTDEAITIKSVATGRELVIPLVENKALSTRRTSKRTP